MSTKQTASVGIFMPCYNLDSYIETALESLKKQTSQDFHLIIADDASTNGSSAKALLALKERGYDVYFEQKNLGLTKIANKYMSLLNTEHIMLLSPEDTIEPTFIEKSITYLRDNPHKAAVCTWIQQFGDYNDIITYDEALCKLPYMLTENYYSGAAVVRKKNWIAAGKHDLDPSLYPNLDYDLWLSMLRRGDSFGVINEPLFNWRSIKSSLSHDTNVEKQTKFKKALIHKYSDLYGTHAEFVLNHYLDQVAKFQTDYLVYEEGHLWLDTEYKRLLTENEELHAKIEHHPHSLKDELKHSLRKVQGKD
jgi:glycosyltransferase involved in cell wall biosynthesis